jgi:hypothetical protein
MRPEDSLGLVWLEDLHLLIIGLAALDKMEALSDSEKRGISHCALTIWNELGHTPEATYCLVSICSSLGVLAEDLRAKILTDWLPRHEGVLKTLRPDKHLEQAWHVITIASKVDPQGYRDRSGVDQFADNLLRLVSRLRPRSRLGNLISILNPRQKSTWLKAPL